MSPGRLRSKGDWLRYSCVFRLRWAWRVRRILQAPHRAQSFPGGEIARSGISFAALCRRVGGTGDGGHFASPWSGGGRISTGNNGQKRQLGRALPPGHCTAVRSENHEDRYGLTSVPEHGVLVDCRSTVTNPPSRLIGWILLKIFLFLFRHIDISGGGTKWAFSYNLSLPSRGSVTGSPDTPRVDAGVFRRSVVFRVSLFSP